MLYAIKGRLKQKNPLRCIIGLPIGEGEIELEFLIPLTTYERLPALGSMTQLFVYSHPMRDTLNFYGFVSAADRTLFANMLRLPGIGPGVALRVLSGFTAQEFFAVLKDGGVEALSKIKGVGPRRAERLAFELARVLPKEQEKMEVRPEISLRAVEALVTLGLKEGEAKKLVQKTLEELGEEVSLEGLIKGALRGQG